MRPHRKGEGRLQPTLQPESTHAKHGTFSRYFIAGSYRRAPRASLTLKVLSRPLLCRRDESKPARLCAM